MADVGPPGTRHGAIRNGLAAAVFVVVTPPRKATIGAAVAVFLLAGVGLLGYGTRVWKLIVTLGFQP